MDFARKQLEKYGWTDGKGLGKHEDGISQPLKPKLKRSVTGVGHDPASDYNEHWWSTLYDKAAKNVEVENKNGKTKKIKTNNNDFIISSSTWKMNQKTSENKVQYSEHFVRTSVLTNDNGRKRMENVRESEIKEVPENVIKMTDEELYAACEGRTAHKGARHGLKALGKLARIAQQEQMLLVQPQYEGYSHAKKLIQAIDQTSMNEAPKSRKKKEKTLENGNTEMAESNNDVLPKMDRDDSKNDEDCDKNTTGSEKKVLKTKKKKNKCSENGNIKLADANDNAMPKMDSDISENGVDSDKNTIGSEKVVSKGKKKKNKCLQNSNSELVESNDNSLPKMDRESSGNDENCEKNTTGSKRVVKENKKKKNKCLENDNTESNDDALPEEVIRDMIRLISGNDEKCGKETASKRKKKKNKCSENDNTTTIGTNDNDSWLDKALEESCGKKLKRNQNVEINENEVTEMKVKKKKKKMI